MMNLEMILEAVDRLSTEDQERIYQHIREKRKMGYVLVSAEGLAQLQDVMQPVFEITDAMTEEEVYAILDEELAEVRRERQTYRSR